jgi:hypothetical protein
MSAALHSNLSVYRAIAEDANAEAQSLWASARQPKPDGSPGFVIAYDPSRRSFKQSLVAIAFAGIYFEALLFVVGTERLGARWRDDVDRKPYEDRLKVLGITDEAVLSSARRLRQSRHDLVHEKAVPIDEISHGELRWAHEEAAHALRFIAKASARLRDAV